MSFCLKRFIVLFVTLLCTLAVSAQELNAKVLINRTQVSNTKSNPSAPRHRNAATPQLLLFNDSLGIRITGINGAIIGRRQGPYSQMLQGQGYISGAHAQLKYAHATGWSIADKHSSNGTRLNDHQLQPDVEMSLKNGDILSLANVPLKVSSC